jgi:hypothetical protein
MISYKTHANTEGKLVARLTEFHHQQMYKKRKRTKTDTSVDTEKIKEQIKQELVAEMRMQNMQM